jgi:hypothetical protein
MDHIDTTLSDTGAMALSLSVKYALIFACKLLNKYYSKSDLSNIYQIAMGMFVVLLRFFCFH